MKRVRNNTNSYISDYFLPDDLYENIMLYSNVNNIKKLSTLNSKFYEIFESPLFWEKKIHLDFPGVLDPEDNDEYTMNHYESIYMSYDEAIELLNHPMALIVFSSNPWNFKFEKDNENIENSETDSSDNDDKVYNVKIIKDDNHYDLIYKISTDEGMIEVSKSLSPRQTVLLVTLYIYYQNVRFQGNIDI